MLSLTNPFKKFRIEHLFFRSFAIIISIVIIVCAWASYNSSSKELLKTTFQYQQRLLDVLNNEITTRLTTIEQISLSTSRDQELVSFLSQKRDQFDHYVSKLNVERALANLTYSIPLIQGIDLYMDDPLKGDAKSYIQFKDRDELEQEEWMQLLVNNDFSWIGEHSIVSFQGEVPVLSFARKIVYNDNYLGMLVLHVKAEHIRTLLSGNSPDTNRAMIDKQGTTFLKIGQAPEHIELSTWFNEELGQSSYVRTASSSALGDALLVYSKQADSRWTFVEITPVKNITASSMNKMLQVIALVGAGALLVTLLMTHYISRQFTKPIKQLKHAMEVYSVGGNNVALPMDYRNEFGYLFAGYRRQNERIEALYESLQQRYEQQRKAEIEALQANINPHFLYNTLDQLNWMAIEAGQDEISRILELMGRMFRIGLSNGAAFIPIEDELKHIEAYLEIQQLRWGEGLEYEISVPASIRKLFIPKLTLQPFVENSIVHGFNAKSTGHISIRMQAEGERLVMLIEDDGHGLNAMPQYKPNRRTGGYGIRNVKERIAGYFGTEYNVSLSERKEGGTIVTITLPMLIKPPKE
ncbi:sensor histidine kinase [Paenibacillus sp. IITD108]